MVESSGTNVVGLNVDVGVLLLSTCELFCSVIVGLVWTVEGSTGATLTLSSWATIFSGCFLLLSYPVNLF